MTRQAIAPNQQENPLNETNLLDKIHLIKSGAIHTPHTDTVAEIQNTLRVGTPVTFSGIEIVAV